MLDWIMKIDGGGGFPIEKRPGSLPSKKSLAGALFNAQEPLGQKPLTAEEVAAARNFGGETPFEPPAGFGEAKEDKK